jgi:hypothetical protein
LKAGDPGAEIFRESPKFLFIEAISPRPAGAGAGCN